MSRPGAMPWDGQSPLALARGWEVPFVEAYQAIGSTNDRAIELATEGAPAWTVVVADEQTMGRGRRGAAWLSAPGSGLWMSVLLSARDGIPELPLLVGVACAEAIESLHDVHVGLKWPNDLFIGGRKVGGVLCEKTGEAVIAGVGINVSVPAEGYPEEISHTATSLEENDRRSLSRNELAASILRRMRALLDQDNPFAAALPAIHERDLLAGRMVETEQEGSGLAIEIGDGGGLVMERADRSRVRIVSGSVRLANADS